MLAHLVLCLALLSPLGAVKLPCINQESALSTPANAAEAPSIAKVWQQVKNNAPTFATIWGLIVITIAIDFVFLAGILITLVPVIYYATDRCPGPSEIFRLLSRKPLRYLLAGFLFNIARFLGLLFFIISGILVILAHPLYVHYVFTTDLNLITCLSKAIKGMLQGFRSFIIVSLLCSLAVIASTVLVVPVLAVLPMAALYMQNYIHHKGLVPAVHKHTRITSQATRDA